MTDPAYENIYLKFHWAFVFMPNVSSSSLPIFMEVSFLVALQELTPGPLQIKVAVLLWSSQPPGGAQGARRARAVFVVAACGRWTESGSSWFTWTDWVLYPICAPLPT